MSVEAIGELREPVRRAVYEYAVSQDEPVGRDEVASACGIGRTLAAFHLDRLATAGLLDVSFGRRSGRTGPGAGRPAKLYRRSATDHEVSLPPRRYLAVAELLAETVERAAADEKLFAVARDRGRSAGLAAAALREGDADRAGSDAAAGIVEVLAGQGYEPQRRDDSIVLRNCPFHALARDYPPLVCGMNLALLEGLLDGLSASRGADLGERSSDGLGGSPAVPRIAPTGTNCCVVIDLASKNNHD
ncbi:helix-turn-helix transcriptional regulator [Rugosimonospora africana]|uniref:Transcriptional regulator n=1 Tax=Rugosimonospora africana TaxID=556532 RepID=A0A8J3QWQ8_9ACTN|nr:transcriptional regulator [Rugosimonospora africana]GIH18544.1 transcriptional regulator [Rugosimonospora africana]